MSETTPVEIVADDQKELLAVAVQNGLLPETTQNLQASFAPLFSQARSIMEKSRGIAVTDVSQKLEIDLARKCRLALKTVRVASDKIRKELKEESLKKGKAIDGFHNILLHLVEAEETRLEEQEKFAERKEAERKLALKTQREELLKPYGVDTAVFSLGDMSDETFDHLLSGTKLAHEAKIAATAKAEADRIAKEKADAEERERVRVENERLKKEAAEAEAALKAERERVAKEAAEKEAALAAERARVAEEQAKTAEIARKEREAIEAKANAEREAWEAKRKAEQDAAFAAAEIVRKRVEAERQAAEEKAKQEREALEAKATAERLAREKLEAEQAAAKRAENLRIATEREAAEKAASAPDKEKLRVFAEQLWGMKLPELTTEGGKVVLATLTTQHEKYIAWITKQSEAL